MKSIAILLPAYNESITIAETIKSFVRVLPGAQIIVIDNKSSDDTALIANKTIKELGCIGSVLFENKKGKGNAIRRAFLSIDADIYIISDADSTYPAEQVNDLLGPIINNKADMVIGDRHALGDYKKENKRTFHNGGNKLINLFVNILFRSNLNDVMSGFRALNCKIVKNYPLIVEGFEIETDLTLFALDKRFRIFEIPIRYKDRPEGSFSKLSTFSDGARVIFIIFQTLRFYKPLLFYSVISLFASSVALILGYTVVNEYFETKVITHLPLAILSASIMIIAALSLGIGLVLDAIAHQNKINFEARLMDSQKNNT